MPETPPATNALPKPALSAPVPAKPAITVPIPRVRRRKPALSRVIPPATNAAMLVTNQMPLPARPTALMAAIHALPLLKTAKPATSATVRKAVRPSITTAQRPAPAEPAILTIRKRPLSAATSAINAPIPALPVGRPAAARAAKPAPTRLALR